MTPPLSSIDYNAPGEARGWHEPKRASPYKTRPRSGQMNFSSDGGENAPRGASYLESMPSTPTIAEVEASPSESAASRAEVTTPTDLALAVQKLARRSQMAAHASSSRTGEAESSRGPRKLSLLTRGSVLNMAPPPLSASALPTPPPSSAASAVRAARAGKRLSLAYMPAGDKRNPSLPTTPCEERTLILPTPSPNPSAGTPSVNNDMLRPFAISRSTSTSSRLSDAPPPEPVVARKANEGDTIVTQHRDVLERIAEKERRIYELKEQLTREEAELRDLRKLWQASAHREMGGVASGTRLGDLSFNGDSMLPADIDAAEALRVLSARVQTGLGSFFEQLNQGDVTQGAGAEERKGSARTVSSSTTASLGSVVEETGTASTSLDSPPTANSKATARNASTLPSKRQSIIGTNGGWSGWQKHLKDARENASSFLAAAEAKIGQAMAVDEGFEPRDVTHAATGSGKTAVDSADEREKAALAELSWLNSLMGVKTDGSVDRAVALKQSIDEEQRKAKDRSSLAYVNDDDSEPATTESQGDESVASARLSKGSSSGRPSISSANTSIDQSLSAGQATSQMSKRVSGLFTALNSMWDAETEQHQREQALAEDSKTKTSGQSRTRVAARVAIENNKKLPSAPVA